MISSGILFGYMRTVILYKTIIRCIYIIQHLVSRDYHSNRLLNDAAHRSLENRKHLVTSDRELVKIYEQREYGLDDSSDSSVDCLKRSKPYIPDKCKIYGTYSKREATSLHQFIIIKKTAEDVSLYDCIENVWLPLFQILFQNKPKLTENPRMFLIVYWIFVKVTYGLAVSLDNSSLETIENTPYIYR
ncbi:hypothetical protein BDC45DRAFT_532360 [Circinella umbellata]|nr:hypothetical protein BDC45DRAFT_532360 [Circinella umbellata]